MKKSICCLAMLVCLCLCMSALAEPAVRVFESSVSMNEDTGMLASYDNEAGIYQLMTPEGEAITTEPYTSMFPRDYGFFLIEVESEDGVHDEGLIDSTGKVIIPPEYGDISYISERWQVGVKLVPCEESEKDYTFYSFGSDDKYYFRIETADFFFDGQKVGTLNRSDYTGYPKAYGAYIRVANSDSGYIYYNHAMEASPVAGGYSEYDETYEDGEYVYIHNGSGQVAFAPDCTLTADEVEESVLYKDGAFYDLQGNEICRTEHEYAYVSRMDGGYFRATVYDESYNSRYGVLNDKFEEIIPVEYDDIGVSGEALNFGYIGVEKDGKFGYVDTCGNVTCDFVYNASDVDDAGTFAKVSAPDGSIIVLSAAVGELPEHYAEVQFTDYEGSMAFAAKNADGAWGIVGLHGKTLVPFSTDIKYVNDISKDGRLVIVMDKDYKYLVYMIDEADLAIDEEASEPAA